MVDTEIKEQMSKNDTIKLRNKYIGKSCQLFYRSDPLKIIRGLGQYLFDEEGNKYLDCINNVAHVGHCHPSVVKAGSQQMATISTNNRFLHDELVKCAQKLSDKMPGDLSVCFFVNSGSEANDLALRLARNYTKQKDIITLDHAYHGHLTAVMEISPYKFNQKGGDPKVDFVHVASCPDTYRGKYTKSQYPEKELTNLYANEIDNIIENLHTQSKGVAGFIAESFQSCGGQIIPPDGYFQSVYKSVRNAGGLVIADEVQVGFARIGTHYWAFEQQNVIPDIVTVAKPMGNGHPVGAVVTTPKIAESFASTGVCYFNTYGGNPVSCAIANAVMDVIDDENLQEKALSVGKYILDKCDKLKKEFELIGDIRGSGLFIGIELVENRETKDPATRAAKFVVDRMKSMHRVLVSSDGPDENVIKLKPPMVFNIENADTFLTGFKECLNAIEIQDHEMKTPNSLSAVRSLSSSKIQENKEHSIKSF